MIWESSENEQLEQAEDKKHNSKDNQNDVWV